MFFVENVTFYGLIEREVNCANNDDDDDDDDDDDAFLHLV
jgi:hypothetical protein